MTPKPSEVQTLREMVRDHMKQSAEQNSAILSELTAIKTHGLYTKEKLDGHDREIDNLKTDNNKRKGAVWAWGITSTIMAIIATAKSFLK